MEMKKPEVTAGVIIIVLMNLSYSGSQKSKYFLHSRLENNFVMPQSQANEEPPATNFLNGYLSNYSADFC